MAAENKPSWLKRLAHGARQAVQRNDPDLPAWPRLKRRGNAYVVTGRHATIPRYTVISWIYVLTWVFGLGLGGLLFVLATYNATWPPTNYFLHWRFIADRWLLDHSFGLLDPLKVTLDDGAAYHLSSWVWAVPWLLLLVITIYFGKNILFWLTATLIGKRTTLRFTADQIILYSFRFIPRRFDRTPGTSISFRIVEHDKAQSANYYAESAHVEMVYGGRLVRVATIIPDTKAEQFGIVCQAAAQWVLNLPKDAH